MYIREDTWPRMLDNMLSIGFARPRPCSLPMAHSPTHVIEPVAEGLKLGRSNQSRRRVRAHHCKPSENVPTRMCCRGDSQRPPAHDRAWH